MLLGRFLPERTIEPATEIEGAVVEDTVEFIPGKIDDYLTVWSGYPNKLPLTIICGVLSYGN